MDNDDSNSSQLFKLIVDFVYDKILNQFIDEKGDCKESTYCLINWSVLTNNTKNGNHLLFCPFFFFQIKFTIFKKFLVN